MTIYLVKINYWYLEYKNTSTFFKAIIEKNGGSARNLVPDKGK